MFDKRIWMELVFIAIGVSVLLFNFFIVSAVFPFIVPFLNIVGGLTAIVPPFLLFYGRYKISKEIEEQFIFFITDLTQSIDSGMTLPMALKHSAKKDYRSMSRFVREINSKVEWGIPFEKALGIFANKINSTPIKRSVSTIIETYKVGGKISDTLKAIGQSLVEISKIRKERSSSVQSQIVPSYLIFFVFIFILVILQTFLIPALTNTQAPTMSEYGSGGGQIPTELYSNTFINFILVQGFFAGLATGKMAEGSLVAGFKHSLLLIIIGYTLFSVFSQFDIALF